VNIDEIAPKALKLPLEQRVLLAATLWDSIEDPYSLSADRSDQEAIALAIQRDEEIESGTVSALDHESLMTRLRAK